MGKAEISDRREDARAKLEKNAEGHLRYPGSLARARDGSVAKMDPEVVA
jgi:hypothetical protein